MCFISNSFLKLFKCNFMLKMLIQAPDKAFGASLQSLYAKNSFQTQFLTHLIDFYTVNKT